MPCSGIAEPRITRPCTAAPPRRMWRGLWSPLKRRTDMGLSTLPSRRVVHAWTLPGPRRTLTLRGTGPRLGSVRAPTLLIVGGRARKAHAGRSTSPATPAGPALWATDPCNRARGRGHDHPHAVRILARAWLFVIWHCWQDGVAYDPARHRALQTLLKQDQQAAA